jgi:hypothetical protein
MVFIVEMIALQSYCCVSLQLLQKYSVPQIPVWSVVQYTQIAGVVMWTSIPLCLDVGDSPVTGDLLINGCFDDMAIRSHNYLELGAEILMIAASGK